MNESTKSKEIIDELSTFVSDVQQSSKEDELFEVPFMIKYQLADEISSTYEIDEDQTLEGISS